MAVLSLLVAWGTWWCVGEGLLSLRGVMVLGALLGTQPLSRAGWEFFFTVVETLHELVPVGFVEGFSDP